jgi:hypothetical protein
VADAYDPVGRRVIFMVLAAEETPVALGSRYQENGSHTVEYVNAYISLLVKVHLWFLRLRSTPLFWSSWSFLPVAGSASDVDITG